MILVNCPNCDNEIPDVEDTCPICKYPIRPKSEIEELIKETMDKSKKDLVEFYK
jgi:predicted amidophosphoribosyltransferase